MNDSEGETKLLNAIKQSMIDYVNGNWKPIEDIIEDVAEEEKASETEKVQRNE